MLLLSSRGGGQNENLGYINEHLCVAYIYIYIYIYIYPWDREFDFWFQPSEVSWVSTFMRSNVPD